MTTPPVAQIRPSGFSPRELLLAAAARVVLAAFREPPERGRLSERAKARLQLLETALEAYEAAK